MFMSLNIGPCYVTRLIVIIGYGKEWEVKKRLYTYEYF